MSFTGLAMVSDHVVVLHQRNILLGAVESANIAATQRLGELPSELTRDEVLQDLTPLVTRYILANLSEEMRQSAEGSLELHITPDRSAGIVDIEAKADLGGAIVGRYLWGKLVDRTTASSVTQRMVVPVDVVLAIDVTGSMNYSIYQGAGSSFPEEHRRISVVRNAAQVLVHALYDQQVESGHVAVGLVPFNTTVNVGAERQDWVGDLRQGHKVIPPGFGPWSGCIEHREDGLDLSLATPSEAPFTAWFWPSTLEYRPAERAALAARIGEAVRGENDWSADNPHVNYHPSPHFGCPRSQIIPLTTDREVIGRAIQAMQSWRGGGTMTHLGVTWGRRLLAPEWQVAWGLPQHDEEQGRKRVIVLLTDGLNNAHDDGRTYPGNYDHGGVFHREYSSHYTGYGRAGDGAVEEGYRPGSRLAGLAHDREDRAVLDAVLVEACELAKAEGITVFTVSAVPRGHPKERELQERLTACASSADHAFVENSDPEAMQAAFREIGRMVSAVRRIAGR